MKICILNSAHPPHDTRVLRIAEALSEYGHNIAMISTCEYIPNDKYNKNIDAIQFVSINKKNVGNFHSTTGLKKQISTIISRLITNIKIFKKAKQLNFDVYHCNEVDSWAVGIMLKFFHHKQLIFDAHEYYPVILSHFLPFSLFSGTKENIFRTVFRFFSYFTDGVIHVNCSLKNLYNFKCHQVTIRNCISKQFYSKIEDAKTIQSKDNNKFVLLHIGKLRESYGSNQLIEALGILKNNIRNIQCIAIGGGNGPVLKKKIKEAGVSNILEIIDFIPFQKVLEYLSLADAGLILLQPVNKNFIYGLPRKLFEYIAAGLPVVASNFPEIRKIVQKHDLGYLINPQDPQSIADAILKLASDSEIRKKFSFNSQFLFQKELNWENERKNLYKLYRDIEVPNSHQ